MSDNPIISIARVRCVVRGLLSLLSLVDLMGPLGPAGPRCAGIGRGAWRFAGLWARAWHGAWLAAGSHVYFFRLGHMGPLIAGLCLTLILTLIMCGGERRGRDAEDLRSAGSRA